MCHYQMLIESVIKHIPSFIPANEGWGSGSYEVLMKVLMKALPILIRLDEGDGE